MKKELLLAAAGLALGWAGAARAETQIVPIEAVKLIDDGAGAHRALLKFEPIEGLGDMAISRAYLAIDTQAGGENASAVEVQVYPITREWWPASVSWTEGWERPGGDFHEDFYARATISPEQFGEELRVDVSSIVAEMRYGTMFYGLMVTALPYRSLGLQASDLERLSGLSSPQLVVEYEPMPHVVLPE